MTRAALGWWVSAALVGSSVAFSVLYVLSVRPAHREPRMGERAYRQCGRLRLWSIVAMAAAMASFVLYRTYPLPIDPLPTRLPWPYAVSVAVAVLTGVPAIALLILGMRDAGAEAFAPAKANEMCGRRTCCCGSDRRTLTTANAPACSYPGGSKNACPDLAQLVTGHALTIDAQHAVCVLKG